MNIIKTVVLAFCVTSFASCGMTRSGPKTAVIKGSSACNLLSGAEIEGVQGETYIEANKSDRSSGGLDTYQCFYRLPTFNKSVSLEVIQSADDSGKGIEAFWEKRFGEGSGEEAEEMAEEREREREAAQAKGAEIKDEEGSSRPEAIFGLGDEAYWSGTQINGSIYARTGEVVVRLGVGGPEDKAEKIRKATELARYVMNRLSSEKH